MPLAALVISSQICNAVDFADGLKPADTIEVHFGEKGTILIQVDSKEDLDALKEYDLNSMLEDIEVPAKEELEDEEKVILEDERGTMYLKDSVKEGDEFTQLEEEFEKEEFTEKEENEVYNYNRKTRKFSGDKTSFVSVLDFGINNYLEDGKFPDDNNQQYTVRPWGSWYVGIMPTWQTHITG